MSVISEIAFTSVHRCRLVVIHAPFDHLIHRPNLAVMLEQILTERDKAKLYHRLLPVEIRRYLNRRGIPDGIINRQLLGWNGRRITIPIFGRYGEILFFRFAKAPDDRSDTAQVLSP